MPLGASNANPLNGDATTTNTDNISISGWRNYAEKYAKTVGTMSKP